MLRWVSILFSFITCKWHILLRKHFEFLIESWKFDYLLCYYSFSAVILIYIYYLIFSTSFSSSSSISTVPVQLIRTHMYNCIYKRLSKGYKWWWICFRHFFFLSFLFVWWTTYSNTYTDLVFSHQCVCTQRDSDRYFSKIHV